MVTAIRKAMAVATSMTASTAGWVVSAEFSAQVYCVQAHHTSQNTTTHSAAAYAKPLIKLATTADGGKRINVKPARLACMSIAKSRLSVRSYTHTISTL